MLQIAETPPPLPVLHSSGHTLSSAPDRLGRLRASDPAEPLESLRLRFDTDGYLWLKGLLPTRDVLDFRGRVFAAFADTGLLAEGTPPRVAVYSGRNENSNLARMRLMEIVRSADYEAFCLHASLRGFIETFIAAPSYLHKRKLLRYTKPGDASATGAHYDLVYLRAGTDRLLTAWIPIGDVPVMMGGLVYLEGSHRLGRRMEAEFAAQNSGLTPEERVSAFNKNMNDGGWISKNLPEMAERFQTKWLAADYEAGDVVLHSPYMIHAATMNEDKEGRLRLSTDIRYQSVRDAIDPRWAEHWSIGDGL